MEEDTVSAIAKYLGANGASLRLLLSLLMCYPSAAFHRAFLYRKPPFLQHLYFIACGSWLGYFSFGEELIHGYLCILCHYLVIIVLGSTLLSVAITFTFQLVYLLTVYYYAETDLYGITWAMPHCVLTLRLIGQAFDLYDGTKKPEHLSKDQKDQALKSRPNILAVTGHVFYPGSFMIGPQFPLKRYLDYVDGAFSVDDKLPPKSVAPGLRRLLIGMIYIAVYQIGSQLVNNNYMLSTSYRNRPFLHRLLILGVYGKIALYKYVSVWIVAEGSCILSGISYNGRNTLGRDLWNGCENVNIVTFEKAYKFSHLIASFNKCTNLWISQYVFKRLKFVGNRYVSQGAALLFLAVWHGLHSGYYMCFFLEFLVMGMEKDLDNALSRNPSIQRWHNSQLGFWIDVIILKLLVTVFFGFCILSFGLLKFDRWWDAYKDLYFIGFIIFGLWPLYGPMVKAMFRVKPDKEKTSKPD